jgi:cell wall-associated NlpC family hydrolase
MKFLAGLLLAIALPDDLARQFSDWLGGNLGRPYVWGATGHKSYDCSGFVWRMLNDNGVFVKRTTARKLYMATDMTEEMSFGTLVFFDDLKHVGILKDKRMFFHASSTHGTMEAPLAPYWSGKIVGFRRLPFADALQPK